MEVPQYFALLGALFNFGTAEIHALVAVFTRIGAMVALLPGFGEQTLPARVRLGATVAFTLIVWPPVAETAALAPGISDPNAGVFARILLAEAWVGLCLGIAVRLMVMAMQLAGSIAAQATSVAQIFGAGVTPDPMPAIGNILTLSAIALALAMGLHIKAAMAMMASYQIVPLGEFPLAADVGKWGVARTADAFALAFSLAAPFVVAAFAYNIALGAINRAMPQLMVALVGAPAITAGTLFILWLSGPLAIAHWSDMLDIVLMNPFGMPG